MPRFGPPLGNDNAHRYNRWPLEHEEALKTCFAEGMSSSAIAAELNWRFHSQYTRNAVIGRRIRMGIKCADPKASSRRPRGAAEPKPWDMAGVSKRQYRRRLAKVRQAGQPEPRPEPYVVRSDPVVTRNLTFAALEVDDCKYPSGDHDFRFCGHMRAPTDAWGRRPPYCAHHVAVAQR